MVDFKVSSMGFCIKACLAITTGLALCACVGTTTSTVPFATGLEPTRAEPTFMAFTDGCLNPDRSMRVAFQAFDANGFAYREPFRASTMGNTPVALGEVRLRSGVRGPSSIGDRTWDTDFLKCKVSRAGLFGGQLYSGLIEALAANGFRAVTPLSPDGGEGIYTRGGERYRVVLGHLVAQDPKVRTLGSTVYLRGNSRTVIEIELL